MARPPKPIPESFIENLNTLDDDAVFELMLEVQATVMRKAELQYFHNASSWLQAQRVLEIGFGPGHPIGSQRSYFPDKEYVQFGLAMEYSKDQIGPQRYNGTVPDLSDGKLPLPTERFDFIILRLMLQHMADASLLITRLRDHLKPGGHILSIDAVDSMARFSPEIKALNEFYQQLISSQEAKGGNRKGSELVLFKAKEIGFEVVQSQKVPISAESFEDKDNFSKVFLVICEVISRKWGARINDKLMIRDFNEWRGNSLSYGQMGLHFLELTMKG